jgi:hypothetical protein
VSWKYEPDEVPKRKHHWSEPSAGFEEDPAGNRVGKCPSGLPLETAQALLDRAIPWSPSTWRRTYPQRLYAVLEGVLYRANPTNPGTSYHGFPEHPSRFPKGGRALKHALLGRAKELGCEAELKRWMRW